MCSHHINTTGWQLCATLTSIWYTDDDVMPNCDTTALRHLLQIWDGAEDWRHDSQWSPS